MDQEDINLKYKKKLLVGVIIPTSILILLIVGFALGYLYTDKGCMENPLIFGIRKMNEAVEEEFRCSCISQTDMRSGFSFDKDNILIGEQKIPISLDNIVDSIPN